MSGAATPTQPVVIPEFKQILGHPSPLWMLFMTEFWERFAFYGIRWALVLYIVTQFHGGAAAGQADANLTYGSYLALVYAGAVFGGYVADRVIGYQRSILIGATFMAAGLFAIADSRPGHLQDRPGHHHRRQRHVQAEHLDHGRQAVFAGRHAPRLRLHHFLHGHQRRRVPRPDPDPDAWPRRSSAPATPRPTRSCSSPPASAC